MSEGDWESMKNLVDPTAVHFEGYEAGLGLKEDGSPYRVLYTPSWLGDDYQVVANGLLHAQLGKAGVEVTTISGDLGAANQVRAIEDAIATGQYDAIILQPLNPQTIAVAVDKAVAAGIDVYSWVTTPNTEEYTGFAGYDADLVETNGQVGTKLVELAEAAGATEENPYLVLEIWGGRSYPTSQTRHSGVHKGIGDSKIVKVIETADTDGNPDTVIRAIQDAFAQYPGIQAMYPHWGDASSFEEGLRSVGRLADKGEDGHVVVFLQDIDKSMLGGMRDGVFDYTLSNGPWPQIDLVMKMFLWHTVLKQPLGDGADLPKDVYLPMPLLTGEQLYTPEGQLFGASVAFADMPLGKWDVWPVLDTTSVGYPVPTLAARKTLLGY
ncbi:MAG: sugar ABC transporter substrate-binding protein [Bauldia sp.]|uniref:sugar ABC transporter substrate-binding protein n=1 Tax=Bauldia sp. TaxID=2575872 RepID=UPI001E15BF66|nr:sugar ABC transporter substrate-binding protein [Bauldia sp.]MCB1494348.1 sugar ABC transporter substrate-binding protein [Bauldia sp.]